MVAMVSPGASDWEWWDECVPQKLRDAHNDGYRIVFFTNQAGMEKLKVTPQEFMKKAEAIIGELAIPVLVRVDICTVCILQISQCKM